jgi:hypothetical protein
VSGWQAARTARLAIREMTRNATTTVCRAGRLLTRPAAPAEAGQDPMKSALYGRAAKSSSKKPVQTTRPCSKKLQHNAGSKSSLKIPMQKTVQKAHAKSSCKKAIEGRFSGSCPDLSRSPCFTRIMPYAGPAGGCRGRCVGLAGCSPGPPRN